MHSRWPSGDAGGTISLVCSITPMEGSSTSGSATRTGWLTPFPEVAAAAWGAARGGWRGCVEGGGRGRRKTGSQRRARWEGGFVGYGERATPAHHERSDWDRLERSRERRRTTGGQRE